MACRLLIPFWKKTIDRYYITIKIEENDQYRVGDVKVTGSKEFNENVIKTVLGQVPGQVYNIEYCDDLRNWKTATPSVSNGSNRIQWIDNGQPKTESFPSKQLPRFYRVITLP